MEVIKAVVANMDVILENVDLLLLGAIGLFMLIPGEQPEKTLQKIVDIIKKFSVKKKAE